MLTVTEGEKSGKNTRQHEWHMEHETTCVYNINIAMNQEVHVFH
jgi:hypothetical protein